MFIDPDQGLTQEQIYEKAYQALPPEVQADILALSEQTGQSRNDIIQQCVDRIYDPIEGPALVADLKAHVDRLAHPFGSDPKRD